MRRAGLLITLLLAGCGGNETASESNKFETNAAARKSSYGELFGTPVKFAAVAAEEGQAAAAGRETMANGGNAIDAAVSMYFAMAVTLPSAAGLGASGACVVHNAKTRTAEAFLFPAVAAPGPIKGSAFTVPSGVRAIALMQIRHGSAQWALDVGPAEKMARFGVPVSRALARDLRTGSALLDEEARRVLTRNGAPLGEGDRLVANDLASTLGAIRQRGAGEFFQGNFARTFTDRISTMGGSLPIETLRGAVPQALPPQSDNYGGYKVYVAPNAGGAKALAAWNGQDVADAPPVDSGGFSGFSVIDDKGNSAACALSMGQLFGAHVMVPGTGVILGAPSGDGGAVSPVVVGNPNNGEVKFAGAGGGSANVSAATGTVARLTLRDRLLVTAAVAARRAQGGWVDAIACPDGLRSGGSSCNAGSDPAGAGLALSMSDL
ncbi:MAG: gamma-glutamyltransferase [Alphaproteobacteria bacterium]|nr:gamma-glutamyltransferase [Alphaproteobacteria bacterium]